MRPVGDRLAECLVLLGHTPAQLLDVRMSRLMTGQLFFRTTKLGVEQRPLDLEPRNGLQIARQAQPAHAIDEPFRWIPLPPAHTVAIVVRKHVMKIVIALAVSQQRHHAIVPGSVVVGVGLHAPYVCQRIDKEGEVMADNQAQHPGKQEGAQNIAGGPAGQQWQAKIHRQCQRYVIAVLQADQRIALQVPYHTEVGLAAGIVLQHPADVRKPEAAARTVGVKLGVIDLTVVHAVGCGPDQRTVLQRHGAEQQIHHLQHRMGFVGRMGEQAMVAAGNRHAVGAQEQHEQDPGGGVKTVGETVPGDADDRRGKGQRKHQCRRPVARHVIPAGGSHTPLPGAPRPVVIILQVNIDAFVMKSASYLQVKGQAQRYFNSIAYARAANYHSSHDTGGEWRKYRFQAAGGAAPGVSASMPITPCTTRAEAEAPLSMKITLPWECSETYFRASVYSRNRRNLLSTPASLRLSAASFMPAAIFLRNNASPSPRSAEAFLSASAPMVL